MAWEITIRGYIKAITQILNFLEAREINDATPLSIWNIIGTTIRKVTSIKQLTKVNSLDIHTRR